MKTRENLLIRVTIVLALVIGINTIFLTKSDATVDFSTNSINPVGEKPNYSVNGQGQTYGNGPYPEGPANEPDLILAEGENGIVGYVNAFDLNPSFSSPTEAINYQESQNTLGYKSIPLYASDGKTVIGEFRKYQSNRD